MHEVSIPDWVEGRALVRFDEIDLATTALLVIDMQVIFVAEGQRFGTQHSRDIIPNINRLVEAVRAGGGLVAYTRHTMTDEGPRAMPDWQMAIPRLNELWNSFRPGTPEHDLDYRMDRQAGDLVLDKYRFSAFTHNSSDLQDELASRGIDTVVVVGVASNCCCETTARDANQLGYKTFFISDATAALTDEEHNASLTNLSAVFADVRSTNSMLDLCRHANSAAQSEAPSL